MTKNEDKVQETLNIIFNSKRPMPAHFSSNDDREMSFHVNFDISANDEYEISSQVYYIMWEFLSKIPNREISQKQASSILKIGEDIALGAFILQRIDEYASFFALKQETLKENLQRAEDNTIEEILRIPLVQNYFDFCQWFGRARANGFNWGK